MATARPVRLVAEIHHEIRVDPHPAVFDIAVDHHHDPAPGANLRVELVVPGGEQRRGDIEPSYNFV